MDKATLQLHDLLQFFKYEHLRQDLQEVSKPFGLLALEIVRALPPSAETTTALRKLLESKDCAVRALLFVKKDDHK